jgi:hypothetical protein
MVVVCSDGGRRARRERWPVGVGRPAGPLQLLVLGGWDVAELFV